MFFLVLCEKCFGFFETRHSKVLFCKMLAESLNVIVVVDYFSHQMRLTALWKLYVGERRNRAITLFWFFLFQLWCLMYALLLYRNLCIFDYSMYHCWIKNAVFAPFPYVIRFVFVPLLSACARFFSRMTYVYCNVESDDVLSIAVI